MEPDCHEALHRPRVAARAVELASASIAGFDEGGIVKLDSNEPAATTLTCSHGAVRVRFITVGSQVHVGILRGLRAVLPLAAAAAHSVSASTAIAVRRHHRHRRHPCRRHRRHPRCRHRRPLSADGATAGARGTFGTGRSSAGGAVAAAARRAELTVYSCTELGQGRKELERAYCTAHVLGCSSRLG